MMDPDYRTFLRYQYPEYEGIDPALLGQIEGADYVHALRNYFEEAGMDLSLLGPIEGEEEEEEEEEEEDEEYNDDGGAVDGPSGTTSGQVVSDRVRDLPQEIVDVDGLASVDADVTVEGERESSSQRRDINGGKEGEAASSKVGSDGESGESGSGEVDGLFCPICYEAWSSGGDHRICCLPCGHIYGLSCIKKWLGRQGSSKCPQCKVKCRVKDIRLLYATRLVAIDEELQKKVQSLEAKCASLEKKSVDLSKKEIEWKKRKADLRKQMRSLKKRTLELENLLDETERRASKSSASSGNCLREPTFGPDAEHNFNMNWCRNKFILQTDFQIDGARLFDIDSSSNIFVFARRLPVMGGMHVLTKVSLLSNDEREDIWLPENTKAIKELQVSPHARLVMLATLGKKLSILSTESNNTILTYDLPAAAWSCSWDTCSQHYVYVGLQNGTVLQFDTRQTRRHVESLTGLTCNPVHTLHSLAPDSSLGSGISSVLTASSLGLCHWDFGGSAERPYLIPESGRQGVCISLAYCKSTDDIVASYRPKVEMPCDLEIVQPTPTAPGQGTRGSHVLYKKMGCTYQKLGVTGANVCDIRLPKSTLIDGVHQNPVLASGDEFMHEMVLQELPSLMDIDRLKPKKYPIRDIKYTQHLGSGLLSCLSEDSFQLFSAKLL